MGTSKTDFRADKDTLDHVFFLLNRISRHMESTNDPRRYGVNLALWIIKDVRDLPTAILEERLARIAPEVDTLDFTKATPEVARLGVVAHAYTSLIRVLAKHLEFSNPAEVTPWDLIVQVDKIMQFLRSLPDFSNMQSELDALHPSRSGR